MGRDFGTWILATLTALLASAAIAAPAGAAGPTKPSAAKVVFMNGNRLIRIDADGTHRKVLTLRNIFVNGLDGPHDTNPVGSPDGTSILFVREDWSIKGDGPAGLMTIDADGRNGRFLLREPADDYISSSAWSPDGSLVYAGRTSYQEDEATSQLLSMKPDGSDLQVLWSQKATGDDEDGVLIAGIAAAPDGRLMLTLDGNEENPRLEMFDPATGELTPVTRDAGWASYSPDGDRVAYVRSKNGWGALRVMDADGSDPVKILPRLPWGDDVRPSWSADGSRIVFESVRDGGTALDGQEIWSVAPDGSCLTRLTNGSPASTSPTWLGRADQVFGPAACGDAAPEPVVELKFPKRVRDIGSRYYWLGPQWNGGLFSEVMRIINGVYVDYGDCRYLDYAKCPGFQSVSTDEVCGMADRVSSSFLGLERIRGAIVLRQKGREATDAYVYTGGMIVDLQTNHSRSFAKHRRMVRALRPVSGPTVEKLPGAVFPRRQVRKARLAVATWRRDGSLEAARRKYYDLKEAKAYLRFGLALEKIGPYGVTPCRGLFNPR
jgi:Tol biopolymer transport system component